MKRSKLDDMLCGHASDLDGQPINVGTLTAHLIRASFDSDRMTAAALLHAWWGPAGDQLSPRLAQLKTPATTTASTASTTTRPAACTTWASATRATTSPTTP